MLKIADSAAIRHHMPTRPRSSCASGISDCGSATVAMWRLSLLVLPIGIFGMLSVPQRTTAAHHRNFREVIFRRRRRGAPLQCPRVPRIVARGSAFEIRPQEIHYPTQDPCDLEDHTQSDDQVPDLPSAAGFVGINAARHAEHSGNVHEVEGEMKADEEQPEVPLAERLIPHAACNFWVPIIERGEDGEDQTANQYIVEMRDHEVRVAELPIE